MANANRPSGLSPVRYLNGVPWNGGGRVYCIPDTDDTNAYAIGDPVVTAGSADSNGVPTVTLATGATDALIRGVIVGMGGNVYGGPGADYRGSLNTIVIPVTKTYNYYVLVVDDPNVLFEIQEDSVGGSIAAASVGLNCNLIAGANNGYLSGWMLDSNTVNAGIGRQCRIMELQQRRDNALGDYAKWIVKINTHELNMPSVGA